MHVRTVVAGLVATSQGSYRQIFVVAALAAALGAIVIRVTFKDMLYKRVEADEKWES